MQKDEKREVPSTLRRVLAVDAYLTDLFVRSAEKFLPLKALKVHYKLLEVSCHGVAWIAGVLAIIWLFNNKNLYQVLVNLLLALILDIIIVAVVKALTRRRRPAVNDDPFAIGPDKYSFPSGHASRSALVLFFFINLWPVSFIYLPPLFAWCVSVCISRLLMRRHHLLDVAMGVIIGIMEGLFMQSIYLEASTCVDFISWITDEKVDGPEYSV